jgi:hypothetical protein
MVINEVATAECIDRGKLARSAGTMTNQKSGEKAGSAADDA